MNTDILLYASFLVPVTGGLLLLSQRTSDLITADPGNARSGKAQNTRDTISIITATILFAIIVSFYPTVLAGNTPSVTLAEPIEGLGIVFTVEPLGLLFATVASGLWILTTIYAIGYMRGAGESHQTRFFLCFAISIAAAIGIAFAGNLLTLFVFYEMLTLATYPLVTHKGNEDARRGGRIYLGILMCTSIGLLLFAVLWTFQLTGTLDFRAGGILEGNVSPGIALILLTMFAFGTGKAALMPFHRWLPAAMVAPTPVSALLHAVAVVKAGVFTILKIVVYVFGIDFIKETGAGTIILWVATFTLVVSSLVALTKDNLKARLAYSTIGQLSYVVVGAMLANAAGIVGAAMQIATHAMGKITLFFCAGAIYVAAHKSNISEMRGLGYKMPFTFGAFFIGAFSIIGLPPLAGSWAKWHLMIGAIDATHWLIVAAFVLSSLLNIAYLIPVAARAFYMTPAQRISSDSSTIEEAPLFCVVPLCITAAGCLLLFIFGDALDHLIRLIPLSSGAP